MMIDAMTLEASYHIPPSCNGLAFKNSGIRPEAAAELRKDWTPADACTRIDNNGLQRTHSTCTDLRVRVPATRRALDRVYPWAYPINDGFYVHTMSFAVTSACGEVDWRFSAPTGTVVLDGEITSAVAERSGATGGGDHMAVILHRQTFNSERLHMDAGFTPQGKTFVRSTLATVDRELRSILPGLRFTMPYTLATVAAEGETWGDVANLTVMRLHLAANPKPEQQGAMRGFVAHEMAHLVQPAPGAWNDSWKSSQALIAEGGAEFLSWAISARNRWATRNELAETLQRAVTQCLLTSAGKSWNNIDGREWGRAPYDCGMTFYAIGLAGDLSAMPPLLRLRDYYQAAKSGERTNFPHALECGQTPACTPLWLSRLGGDEAVEAILIDYAKHPGAIFRRGSWTQPMTDLVRRRYVNRLIQLDCQGMVSVSYKKNLVRVGPGLRCEALREGMEIVKAEGVPIFGNVLGLQASARSCAERGSTTLGLSNGRNVELACDNSAYMPTQIFSVDIDRVLKLTK